MVLLGLIGLTAAVVYGLQNAATEERCDKMYKNYKEKEEDFEKTLIKKYIDEFTIERLVSDRLPVNNFSVELKETILDGLLMKTYESIDGEYYWIKTIAEYENFTVEKTKRILEELFAENLIELVIFHYGSNYEFLCCKLK